MEHYWHVFLEALVDTAKMLPLLFVVYYLIELIEFKYAIKFQNNKWLNGKASPVIGTLIGCVPQCGFSVVSTDLFTKGSVSIGALIGVYIATSDEALPLMIANPKYIPALAMLILVKIVMGIAVGYLAGVIYKLVFRKEKISHDEDDDHDDHDDHENEEEVFEHGGCCHHHVRTKSFEWLHPMLHCLKISAFVLVVNFVLGCVTHIWIGEQNLAYFMQQSFWLQPLFAVLVGLIPNCASSVALAEMFMAGGIKFFGGLAAGLCANAGLGLVILLKQNKNWKQNLFIILMLVIPSLILGYLLNVLMYFI